MTTPTKNRLDVLLRRAHYLLACLVATALLAGSGFALGEGEDLYNSGQNALAAGRFDDAIAAFKSLAASGPQADRALYWVGYTEAKAGRKKAALATLKRLQQDHPSSAWIDDAQALEVELRGVDDPSQLPAEDEELKLYALHALHNVDPDKAVKMLEDFLRGKNASPRLREQALFVLAQIDSPRASQLLLEVAKGGGPFAGLQREALLALGASGEAEAVKALAEIYRSTTDRGIKKEIIHALVAADGKEALVTVIRSEKDPELLEDALHSLGAADGAAELEALAPGLPASAHGALLQAIGISGDEKALLRIVRAEKDPARLIEGLEALAIVDGEQVAVEAAKIYREHNDPKVKRAALNALFVQDAGKELLELFRSEKDRQLRQEIFQFLTMIDDPTTEKLLEETLKN